MLILAGDHRLTEQVFNAAQTPSDGVHNFEYEGAVGYRLVICI